MPHAIIRLQFQDALRTSMGGRIPAPYQCVIFIRLTKPDFTEDDKEAFFRSFYGENWKSGNEDGSRYEYADFSKEILTSEAAIQNARDRQADKAGPKSKAWYFVEDKDTGFRSVSAEEMVSDS